jgi:hypothetical protein
MNNKRISFFIVLAILTLFSLKSKAQSSAATLDVVSWNIEWFGASFDGPTDDNLQEVNVKKVLRYLNADLYGLVEVVDTSRFRKVVDSLGANWGYVISPFCSNNTTGTGNSWLSGQKLAFVYNKNIFTNVKARGLLRSSSTAYANWASGRFPFMLTADVTINSTTKTMNFILLHGKSGSTPTDYQRRKDGAQELKDTLDAEFPAATTFIMGDFNDALNQTICSGCGTNVSSYESIVKDSTDADHYRSITMPLANTGQSSMTNFPNVIDNHVISNELEPYYIPGSVKIRTDVLTQIASYDVTTSDHYPVFSQYNLNGVTAVPNLTPDAAGIKIYPNPFRKNLQLSFGKSVSDVDMQITDMQGRIYFSQSLKRVSAGTILEPLLPSLSKGSYFLSVRTKEWKTVIKLEHL